MSNEDVKLTKTQMFMGNFLFIRNIKKFPIVYFVVKEHKELFLLIRVPHLFGSVDS